MSKTVVSQVVAVHKVLRYIKSSPDNDLFYPTQNETHIKRVSDSEWPACHDKIRSITWYSIYTEDSSVS